MFSLHTLTLSAVLLALASTCQADPQCDPSNPLTPVNICQQRAAFGGSLVVPDVIPSFLPTGYLHLVYGTVDVGGAQQLSPIRVASTPTISYVATPGTVSGPTYILVVIDPDTTRPDILHWMQTDLTVQPQTNLLMTTIKPAAYYNGPNPPQGGGTHRYVALLYTQPPGFVLPVAYQNMPTAIMAGSARIGFSLPNFLTAAGLGAPVGGNFFKSTFDGTGGTTPNTVQAATGPIPGVGAATTPNAASTSAAQVVNTSPVPASLPVTTGSTGAIGQATTTAAAITSSPTVTPLAAAGLSNRVLSGDGSTYFAMGLGSFAAFMKLLL